MRNKTLRNIFVFSLAGLLTLSTASAAITLESPTDSGSSKTAAIRGNCGSSFGLGQVNITTNPENAFSSYPISNYTLDIEGNFNITGLDWKVGSYELLIECNSQAGTNRDERNFDIVIKNKKGASSIRFTCKDESASNYDPFGRHKQSKCEYGSKKKSKKACPVFTQHMMLGDMDGQIGKKKQEADATKVINEVKLLQETLKDQGLYQGKISGVYDQATKSAVEIWQTIHYNEVLKPWGLKKATGIFYQSSERWMNELLGCQDKVILDNGVKLGY
ncbi:hypothetical protein CSB11_02830 [Candidatus Campbellbacteria bacterium]|nr:MAG: hypothetical protein CSB11_02830 [Candidatus Campbellbacteria bacterium]